MSRQRYDNPDQLDLLAIIKQQEATLIRSSNEPGSLNMSAAVREALAAAIAASGKSRWQIAAEMSELIDTEISKTMLDAWTASSKDGYRFPLEYAAAFCRVTACNKPLEVICRPVGMYALDGPDALRSQLQRLKEDRLKMQHEEKELARLITQFERGATR